MLFLDSILHLNPLCRSVCWLQHGIALISNVVVGVLVVVVAVVVLVAVVVVVPCAALIQLAHSFRLFDVITHTNTYTHKHSYSYSCCSLTGLKLSKI